MVNSTAGTETLEAVRAERIRTALDRAAAARVSLIERLGGTVVSVEALERLEGAAVDARRLRVQGATAARPLGSTPCDLFITHNEVCRAHGTGILAMRLMEESERPVLIRSDTLYGGECGIEVAEEFVLGKQTQDGRVIHRALLDWLAPYDIRLIVSIPFHEQELKASIAAQAMSSGRLVTYIMDDNCLTSSTISRGLMRQALSRSDLRLAISPQMRDAYEAEFGLPFEVVPPVVSEKFIASGPSKVKPTARRKQTGVIIGNVWSSTWSERLRETIRGSGRTLHWYYGGERPHWMTISPERLLEDGIVFHAETPQEEVNAAVAAAAFVVIPYGTLEESGHELGIARLSLPSRMPFVVASAGAPMLVLGHPESGAGRFVLDFGLGEVADYDSADFLAAVERLCAAPRQAEIRARAAELAPRLASTGLLEMIRRAAAGEPPADDRFAAMFPRPAASAAAARPGEGPEALLRRLAADGYAPANLLDPGLPWSAALPAVFPHARAHVFDPTGWTEPELPRERMRWLDQTAAGLEAAPEGVLAGADLSHEPALTFARHSEVLLRFADAALLRTPLRDTEGGWGASETVTAMSELGYALTDQGEAPADEGRRMVDQVYRRR